MELTRGEFQLCSEQQDAVKLNYNKGSLMQGMIMERIRPSYGELLHKSELKPYSQYLYLPRVGNPLWVLNTLTHEAAEEIWSTAQRMENQGEQSKFLLPLGRWIAGADFFQEVPPDRPDTVCCTYLIQDRRQLFELSHNQASLSESDE